MAACPECGDPLVKGGTFCRGCGYDAELEGGEDGYLDGIDLPQGYRDEDPDFDYEAALADEGLGAGRPRTEARVHPAWFVVAAIALLILVALAAG